MFTKEATLAATYITKKMIKWSQEDLGACLSRLQDRRNIPPEVAIGIEHLIGGQHVHRRKARRAHHEAVLIEYKRQLNSGFRDPDELACVSMISSKPALNRAVNTAAFVANMDT